MTTDIVIVAAARTAVGKAPRGALRSVHTADLAATAIKAAIERAPGAAIFDEETSASAAVVDGRARRSRTVGIVVGATIGGAALVGVLAMALSKGSSSNPGAEGTTTVAPLLPASQASAALPAPSATPSAATPPPPPSASAPEPPPTVAAPLDASGKEDLAKHLGPDVSCVVVQNPSFFGHIHDFTKLAEAVHAAGALLIVAVTEVVSLGLLTPPGEMGAEA